MGIELALIDAVQRSETDGAQLAIELPRGQLHLPAAPEVAALAGNRQSTQNCHGLEGSDCLLRKKREMAFTDVECL